MFRISLREMLVLVAAIALAIVSLLGASIFWQGVIGLVTMLAAGAAIMAGIFERGPRQAFAIGFAVALLGYALLVLNAQKFTSSIQNVEMVGLDGQLPTSLLLRYLYVNTNRSAWVDAQTEKVVAAAGVADVDVDYSSGNPTLAGRPVRFIEQPPAGQFAPIGHFWWGLLFGYLGGRFSQYLYAQRKRLPN